MGGMVSSVSGTLLFAPHVLFQVRDGSHERPQEVCGAGFKQQNHIRGPPLQLSPEEATLLLEQGVRRALRHAQLKAEFFHVVHYSFECR